MVYLQRLAFLLYVKITDLSAQQVVIGFMCWQVSFQPPHSHRPFMALKAIVRVLAAEQLSEHSHSLGVMLHSAMASTIQASVLFFILFALADIIMCYVAILVRCRHHYSLWMLGETQAAIIRPICMHIVCLAPLVLRFKMQIGSHKALRVT